MGKTSTDVKTRQKRKFEKKVEFYELVRREVAQKIISKGKRRQKQNRQKKLKAYDLSALSEFLPEAKAPQEPKHSEFKVKCKNRNNLLQRESNQFKTVINHPVFQSDPLGAIYQHLKNTQPAKEEKPKRKDGKSGKKKAKGKKSSSSLGVQSMEM